MRWQTDFSFAYSRRDAAWQLVRVENTRFHAPDAETSKTLVERPPRHFGKIDLQDFDPDHYIGVGPR